MDATNANANDERIIVGPYSLDPLGARSFTGFGSTAGNAPLARYHAPALDEHVPRST
jgi:hypothetical protein